MWSAVPTMVERVLADPDLERHDVTSLRTVVLGGRAGVGEPARARLACSERKVQRRAGLRPVRGGRRAHHRRRQERASRHRRSRGAGGRAPHRRARRRRCRRDPRPVARGHGGVLGIPDDPILTPDGWLRSGDLGRIDDDGFLTVTGRLKDMIIRGGENIAPAHIEAYLLEHPDVREVAVIGLPHPDLGEEVGAVVVLVPGSNVTADELRRVRWRAPRALRGAGAVVGPRRRPAEERHREDPEAHLARGVERHTAVTTLAPAHVRRGRPSTRSARMLRCTSSVPPPDPQARDAEQELGPRVGVGRAAVGDQVRAEHAREDRGDRGEVAGSARVSPSDISGPGACPDRAPRFGMPAV